MQNISLPKRFKKNDTKPKDNNAFMHNSSWLFCGY
ncbi:hypothetical protein M2263_000047 [Providencia alcalifaciens]|nr:hypothetical protein [Providencia alcalifaciens]